MDDQEVSHDEKLTQFLSMTEDRVDPDVARSLLEAMGWDVQAAILQLFDGPGTPSRPQTAEAPLGVPPARRDVPDVDFDDAVFADAVSGSGRGGFPTAADLGFGAGHPAGLGFPGAGLGLDGPGALGGAVPTGDNAVAMAEDLPQGMDDAAQDPHLAAAIAASYSAQTGAGMQQNEDELMEQAIRASQLEEEARQRQQLRDQQEMELQESMLMDNMREQEQRRAGEEAEALRQAAESSKAEEERRQQEEGARAAAEQEAKRARVPQEPAVGQPGRLALVLRLPNGQRLQRAFLDSDPVGALYDFVDVQGDPVAQPYRLVSTMPRKAFEDRQQSLSEAGIQNQFALTVEIVTDPN